ncbi:MAG: hypothetical protein KAR45_02275, partial [Desulfobacteraceae bacterium]|nr:hypothetical protein [Desulfobacteraceae bacterium]
NDKIQLKYLKAKTQYYKVYEELGDITYELQNQQLENKNVIARYRSKFPEIIEVQQHFYKLAQLKQQKQILESDPTLSLEQVLEMTAEKRSRAENKINDMRLDAALGERKEWMLSFGRKMDDDELAKEKEKGKNLARQIAMLTHDDVVKNNPQYKFLTKNQKQELKKCFCTAMDVKTRELGFSPSQVGFHLRSSMELKYILDKVEKILANAGIDVNVDLIPTGETINQKMGWFKEQIYLLDAQILQAKATLVQLLNDPDVKENRKHLACPELYGDIRTGLKKLTEKYREESRVLAEAISEIIYLNEA